MASHYEAQVKFSLEGLNRHLASGDVVLSDPSQVSQRELDALGRKLDMYYEKYNSRAEEYLRELSDPVEYEKEGKAHQGISERVMDMIAELGACKSAMTANTSSGNGSADVPNLNSSFSSTTDSDLPKLPPLKIGFYDGDPMKWAEFWDCFSSTIHRRPNLSGVEKFKYLQSYLKGDAHRLLSGYSPSNENYETAVEHLKDRFGDSERIEQAHISELLAMSVAGKETRELRNTLDECERHIRCLISLGLQEEHFGRFFAPIMLSKFPFAMQTDLNRAKTGKAWTLAELRKRISDEIGAREGRLRNFGQNTTARDNQNRSQPARQPYNQSRQFTPPSSTPTRTTNSFQVNAKNYKVCAFCGERHFSDQCSKYPDVASRKERLKQACKRCLSFDHYTLYCPIEKSCAHCSRTNHHRSFCLDKFPAGQSTRPPPQNFTRRAPTQTHLTVHAAACERNGVTCVHQTQPMCGLSGTHTGACGSSTMHAGVYESRANHTAACDQSSIHAVARDATTNAQGAQSVTFFSTTNSKKMGHLHTAQASVEGSKVRKKARLLLDNGMTTVTFMTNQLAKLIGAKLVGKECMSTAGFQSKTPQQREYDVYELKLFHADGSHTVIQAHATESISCPIMRYAHDLKENPILMQVTLADTICEKDESVHLDILIGGDYYYDIVLEGQLRYSSGLVLLNTKLGYVVGGRASGSNSEKANCMMACGLPVRAGDDLQKLWELEEIGIKDPVVADNDDKAVEQFNDSISFNEHEKRYAVNWPWNENKECLKDNFGKAYGRLSSLLNRLKKMPTVFNEYTEIIQKQVDKGVVEVAPKKPDGTMHYMPHHEVLKPERETTKLRVVYDGSCKPAKHEVSLNECLLRGPVILEDLGGLLMRFRLNKVALTSDIEKGFLQISLHKDQRDVTRFLWVKDVTKPPAGENLIHYRFARVCFGTNASPFLLGATIQHMCKQAASESGKKITSNLYVDNIILGMDSSSDALEFYKDAKRLFASASMNLRQFYSNDKEVMQKIAECDRGTLAKPKVLGLTWDTAAEALHCPSTKEPPDRATTKRLLLQAIAKAYDPCGYFSPVTIRGKVMMQQLWLKKLTWDEILSAEDRKAAFDIVSNIRAISEVQVPRCIALDVPKGSKVEYQLHCFSDASFKAFSVAVFLRQKCGDKLRVDLVFSKSRVAPLQGHKTPQLELLAATLSSKVAIYVRSQLRLNVEKTYVWCDSTCVLHWILGRPVSTVFVKNRVEDIKKRPGLTWRYVPTETNPADIPTRGMTCVDLKNCEMWWYGPEWLWREENSWPENITVPQVAEVQSQVGFLNADATNWKTKDRSIFDLSRISSLSKALGVVSKVLRLSDQLRKKSLASDNCYRERAQQILMKEAQCRHEQQPNYKSVVRQLRVYKDSDGVYRCAGRLESADLTSDPILLPKTDPLTSLLVRHYHEKLQHAETSHVLSELRYDYWIPQARRTIKGILYGCTVCRRHRGPPYRLPEFPPLPKFRTEANRPFECTGIDYLGPLYIRVEADTKKVWICLFTCSVTRAVHLEVVDDMTAYQFLLAMRRFMSWYGTPKLIISDNAKQFETNSNVFRLLIASGEVTDFCKSNQIEWKFIVEMAPWMGGFYERMVGIVKKSLKTAIHLRKLTVAELQTVVYEVSVAVNSRPLVYNEDEVSFHPISPSHLLMRHRSTFTEIPATKVDEYYQQETTASQLVKMWNRLQNVVDKFWNTWKTQYLAVLRDSVWKHKQGRVSAEVPKEGDVVLIEGDKQPRAQWQMGRIEKLIPSTDKVARAAIVVLPDKRTFRRPIKLLYPLEMSSNKPSESPSTADSQERNVLPIREGRPKREKAVIAARKVKDRLELEAKQVEAELTEA